jgi:DNA helicase-2/ATP-dependent DNA helicase PcrA
MAFAYSSPLNNKQREAADHNFGAMLVRAGAGTGKTTVLTQRIYRLVSEGLVPANQILAITFTNAAAEEMQDRLAKLLGKRAEGLRACTFHSYCHSVLHRHDKTFGLLSKEDLWVYLRKNIEQLGLKYFAKASEPGTFLSTLLDFFDRCNDELVNAADYSAYVDQLAAEPNARLPRVGYTDKRELPSREETIARCREIARVFYKVENMLAEQNVGSFGSLIVRTARLFRSNADALAKEQRRARLILVDEFQDTNHSQLQIVRLLAGSEGNVFVVGDPDQAIYRFRGASAGAFEDFRRAFPNAKSVTLAENQRSVQNVLNCAYEAIRHNPDMSDLESDFQRQLLRSGRMQRDPSLADPTVRLMHHDGHAHEAQAVARLVAETAHSTGDPWKNFAVIYRAHSAAPLLVEEFGARGIPVSVTGTDLLETEHGRDLLAALSCMLTLDDSVSVFRVAMMPRFGLDPAAVQRALKTGNKDKRITHVVAALETFAAGERFIAHLREIYALVASDKTDALNAAQRAVEAFGMKTTVEAHYLLKFVEEWMQKPCIGGQVTRGKLADFLDYLKWWRASGASLKAEERDVLGARRKPMEEPNAVKLMTVHAAKGLEFKHTFIVRTVSQSFPLRFKETLFDFPQELRKSKAETASEKELHEQEERRLFYVAVTRSKDHLTILGKHKGKDPVPSVYMRELGKAAFLAQSMEVVSAPPFVIPEVRAAASTAWHELPATLDPKKLKLSASAIEAYDACPKQFYFQYEWSLPNEASAYSQYGSAMHLALRSLYDSVSKNRVIDEPTFLSCFEAEFRKYENSVEEKYQFDLLLAQGRNHLSKFYREEIVGRSLPQVRALEEYFEFDVDGVTVHGKIDRADDVGDGVTILDYKTGSAKTEKKAQDSVQLSVYALAAIERWKRPVVQVGFYNLETSEAVYSERTKVKLEEIRAKILAVAEGIRNGEFPPKPNDFGACRFCGYRTLCPATVEKYFDPRAVAESITF